MLAGMYLTADEQTKAYWYVNPITRLPDFFVGVLLYQIYQSLHNKKISSSTGTLLEVASVALFLLFLSFVPQIYLKYTVILAITGYLFL